MCGRASRRPPARPELHAREERHRRTSRSTPRRGIRPFRDRMDNKAWQAGTSETALVRLSKDDLGKGVVKVSAEEGGRHRLLAVPLTALHRVLFHARPPRLREALCRDDHEVDLEHLPYDLSSDQGVHQETRA